MISTNVSNGPFRRVKLPYGDEAVLLTRYGDVRAALADPRFSRAATLVNDVPRHYPESNTIPGSLMDLDPPEHTRLRKPAAKALTVRRVELLRPKTTRTAGELLDHMEQRGAPADLVADFALPLPGVVLCELLGVPFADRSGFGTWMLAYTTTAALTPGQRRDHAARLRAYLASLVAERRQDPADDLVSDLTQNDLLTERELVDLLTVLLVAGFDTTAAHLTYSVHTLLANPGQWNLLRDKPELVPGAVEELLRHVPLGSEAALPRYATEDVELSGGTVRRGEPVLLARAAANRDPEVFADPDRLDVTRGAGGHLGFGHGPHHCAGAQLARMNLQVALACLVTRFPELRLAVPEEEVRWRSDSLVRGPLALPVTW